MMRFCNWKIVSLILQFCSQVCLWGASNGVFVCRADVMELEIRDLWKRSIRLTKQLRLSTMDCLAYMYIINFCKMVREKQFRSSTCITKLDYCTSISWYPDSFWQCDICMRWCYLCITLIDHIRSHPFDVCVSVTVSVTVSLCEVFR